MLELTKRRTTAKHYEICIKAPARDAEKILDATREFLRLAGHEVREVDLDEEKLFDACEVFPDSHPGRILRGLRTREDMTQAELAAKAGLKPHHISEMENAKRPIGKEVAKRLAGALNSDFRILL
jgi:DNA-binding XRE family transcriptional regulator